MRGISLIMPVYHSGKRQDELDHLRQAVLSLVRVRQLPSMPPHELIIVDDGSPNLKTRSVISDLIKEYDPDETWIKIILNDKNVGPSYARNCALAIARYDLVTGLDADNLLTEDAPEFYKKAVDEMLSSDSKIAVYVSRYDMFGFTEGPVVVPKKLTPKILVTYGFVDTSSVFRREELLSVNGWRNDSPKAEDYKLAISVLAHRWRHGLSNHLPYSKELVMRYRTYDDNLNVHARPVPLQDLYSFLFKGDEDFIQATLGHSDIDRFLDCRRTKEIVFDIVKCLQEDFWGTVNSHLSRSSKLTKLFNAAGLENPFKAKSQSPSVFEPH